MLFKLRQKASLKGLGRASLDLLRRLRLLALASLAGVRRTRRAAQLDAWGAVARLERVTLPPAVIVPIYDAPDEVERCLAALAKHTPADVRIILVDDSSPDPRIAEMLETFAGQELFEIYRNPGNLGFTRSVNRGMELAGRADVVLLNSDTEVTPHWLKNLKLAAYSGDRVATATPFSNNAGPFSVPKPNENNTLLETLALDGYARLVTQASRRRYPRLPTGHGFCLYIRRDCIDEVGQFDAEAFPLGYGEENDFCMRASRLGWSHVVDDATFIYHVRSASFGAAKADLLKSAGAVLARRYPDYASLVRGIGRNVELIHARSDLTAAIARVEALRSPVLPRALFVIGTQVGGTPQTNQDLMAALGDRYDTLVLHCDARTITLTRFVNGAHQPLERARLPKALQPFPHVDESYDRIVAGWIAAYAIEIVHIRHLVWHSLSLPRIAKALGVPVVFSFHDFYAICPTVRLVDENDVFCAGNCTKTPGPCRQALWKTKSLPPLKHQAVHEWRGAMAEMLSSCDAFVTTSGTTKDLIQRFFPIARRKPFPVIEHGRDFPEFHQVGRPPGAEERVRILVPGNISNTKGARILKAVQELDRESRFEFHVLGQPSRELKGVPGIVTHGPYGRARFGELTHAISPHFGVVLSIWPETFCHTLTEMWACGLPVAAFDLGAVGERIRRHGGGWLVEPITPEAAYHALVAIASDHASFETKLTEVHAWQRDAGRLEDCAWMANAYADLYQSVSYRRRIAEPDKELTQRSPRVAAR